MNTSVKGTAPVSITAKIFGDIHIGDFVTMKANGEVQKATTDSDPIGICSSINGDYIAVTISGGISTSCDDSTLTVGFSPIKVTSTGTIAKATTGKLRLITAVDSILKKAELII